MSKLSRTSSKLSDEKNIFVFHAKDSSIAEEHLGKSLLALVKNAGKAKASSSPSPQRKEAYLSRFSARLHSLEEIANALSTADFFAAQTQPNGLKGANHIVFVEEYDALGGMKIIQKLIESCPDDAILYLVKNDLPFSSKAFENFLRKHPRVLVHLEFFISKDRIQRLLNKDLAKAHLHLDNECLAYLSDIFMRESYRMAMLHNETAKIKAYFHGHKEALTAVNLPELKDLIAEERQEDSFSVIEAILLKNRVAALRHFSKFLKESGNMMEFCMIMQQELRKLIEYKEMLEKNIDEERIFERLRLYYKRARQSMQRRSRHFTKEELCDMLEAFLIVETSLKSEGVYMSLAAQAPKVHLIAKCQIEKTIISCL